MKNKIQFYRKARTNLTQEQMAGLLFVSRQSYISYENGEFDPSMETLLKISQILKTSIDDLYENEIFPSDRDAVKNQLINEIESVVKKYK